MVALSPRGDAVAGSMMTDLPFSVASASMWGPGPGFSFNASDFIGLQFNESLGFGPLLGFELSANVSGKVGLEYEFSISSGTVDVDYPATATVSFPDQVDPGEVVNISSSSMVLAGAKMTTMSPQATARLALPFEFGANATGTIDVIGFDPVPFTLFPSFSIDATHTFFDISTMNPSFSFMLGDSSITASIPTVNTMGTPSGGMISTSGSDNIINVNIDLDEVASFLIPQIPPLSGSLDITVFDTDIASVAFDLLDVDADLDVNAQQNFTFMPGLKVLYTLETGQQFTKDVDEPLSFVMPSEEAVGGELDVNAKYFLDNTFQNDTEIVLVPGITLSILSGSVTALGLDLLDFGPLFQDSVSTNINLDVFSNQFPLDFAMYETNFSIMVPEPDAVTLLLVALGALALYGAGSRTRRFRRTVPGAIDG